jgi:hypothetical protein
MLFIFSIVFFCIFGLLLIIALYNPASFKDVKTGKIPTRKNLAIGFGFFILLFGFLSYLFHDNTSEKKVTKPSESASTTVIESTPSQSLVNIDQVPLKFVSDMKGSTTKVAVAFIINNNLYTLVEKKSEATVYYGNLTLANKPAVGIDANAYNGDERIHLSLILNRANLKTGAIFESLKANETKPEMMNLSLTYNDVRYHHNLIDAFPDTLASVYIYKIENGIAYANFRGTLYDTRKDRNSIHVNGKMMFRL